MEQTIDILGGMFDSTSVVETVDGFPRGDKAVDAAFFARMMMCFYSDGVVRPGQGGMQVTAGDGMTVRVSAGCGWIRGHMAWLTEDTALTVDGGHTYAVVLRLHSSDGRFTLETHEDHSDLVRSESTWDLLLAEVSVPSGSAAVSAEMITDRRNDPEVCGAVDSPVDSLQAVEYAANCGSVGGIQASELVPKSGCTMTGTLRAHNDTTGGPAVRNIRYGTSLPETVSEGEIFILLAE